MPPQQTLPPIITIGPYTFFTQSLLASLLCIEEIKDGELILHTIAGSEFEFSKEEAGEFKKILGLG